MSPTARRKLDVKVQLVTNLRSGLAFPGDYLFRLPAVPCPLLVHLQGRVQLGDRTILSKS
jgi:hypothetical protein